MNTETLSHRLRVFAMICIAALLLIASVPARGFEIVDDDGVSHHFSGPATRIISLYPAHSENLAALGAERSLLGISTSDSYPDSIRAKPRFSQHDSLEKLIAAAPDCILIRPMISRAKPELIEKLRAYGIPVVSLQPTSVDELYQYWRTLGRISGCEASAEGMITSFQTQLRAIAERPRDLPVSARPRVYFESIHARMRTFSPDSISMFCVEAAGGVNVAGDAVPRHGTNIADYGKERILAKAHSIDVFLAQTGRMNRITIQEIIDEPGFGAIKAVREGEIYLIDEQLVSRPTMRLLDAIRQIQHLLYPKSFS